ncbi:hypothetical protein D9758_008633 [Tetrapyrgos nigripes]|uniref:Uncharacterized protein n=1 Tax=Tetrapyrgos nigripes TaxID=182062 RepID=A0A8H5D6P4_9AGAR|nr:hypothetical protein D9758_008633 [Tetrapyrgos nigripes]
MLFSNTTSDEYFHSIQEDIKGKAFDTNFHKRRVDSVEAVEGLDDPGANKEHHHAQVEIDKLKKAEEILCGFYNNVKTDWGTDPENHILGRVILSAPIGGGGGEGTDCTEDWAIIEIDPSKLDAQRFQVNTVNLGTRSISITKLKCMMSPEWNPLNPKQDDFDYNGNPCLLVLKCGYSTGLVVSTAFSLIPVVINTSVMTATSSWFRKNGSSSHYASSVTPPPLPVLLSQLKATLGRLSLTGPRIGGMITAGAGSKALSKACSTWP